jgi:hypothetical protein
MLARRRHSLLSWYSCRSVLFSCIPMPYVNFPMPFPVPMSIFPFPFPFLFPMPDILFRFPMHCVLVVVVTLFVSVSVSIHTSRSRRNLPPHSSHALLLPHLILRRWRITKLEILLPPVIGLRDTSCFSLEACAGILTFGPWGRGPITLTLGLTTTRDGFVVVGSWWRGRSRRCKWARAGDDGDDAGLSSGLTAPDIGSRGGAGRGCLSSRAGGWWLNLRTWGDSR